MLRAALGKMPGIICSPFLYILHPYNLKKKAKQPLLICCLGVAAVIQVEQCNARC